MKKLALMIAIIAMGIMNINGQTTADTIATQDSIKIMVSGEIQIATINMLPMTGLALEKDAASINATFNIGVGKEKWAIGLTAISQKSITGSGTTYNLIDVVGSYRPTDNLSITAGYELTLWDHTEGNDKIGHNLICITNWTKNKGSITGIMLVDVKFSSIYLILSGDLRLTDHLDAIGLVGYGNQIGLYGMAGAKCSIKSVNIGLYGLINKNPGIGIVAGWSF